MDTYRYMHLNGLVHEYIYKCYHTEKCLIKTTSFKGDVHGEYHIIPISNKTSILSLIPPPWGPGGLSREYVLRIPMRVVKGD